MFEDLQPNASQNIVIEITICIDFENHRRIGNGLIDAFRTALRLPFNNLGKLNTQLDSSKNLPIVAVS